MKLQIVCLAALTALGSACAQSEIALPGGEDVPVGDVIGGDQTPAEVDPVGDKATGEVGETSPVDGETGETGPNPDTAPPDGSDSPTGGCEEGTGCFGEPCDEADDCMSGWCVDQMGDLVCTETCEEDCPQGWACKKVVSTQGDVAFICVSDHTHLCRPCVDAAGCKSTTGVEDVCVDYGNEGNFCGSPCDSSADCPEGFSCQEADTTTGGKTFQCVHDEGVCACSVTSINLALQTTCSVTSEEGTCSGTRTCTPEGLSPCSVAAPTDETCNGVDDDCDGETDEATCDDGDPCTGDVCDGVGCVDEPLTGGGCDDGSACTQDDHCDTGFCLGKGVDCDDDNPCTTDWCSQAEGCIHEETLDPCDDGDPCTTDDACTLEGCVGDPQACQCWTNTDCLAVDDGNACNGTLICDTSALPYACVTDPESVVVCELPDTPNSFCKSTWCEPATGTCFTGTNNNGIACDDLNACTVGEGCSQGICKGAVPVDCDDGSVCTSDTCDLGQGCLYGALSGPCTDGDACTVSDACFNGSCLSGPSPDCDDQNPCTADTCDGVAGCQNLAMVGFCDDGDLCTTGDKCIGGVCSGTDAFQCNDQNPCTDDVCQPAFGCLFPANDNPCDDLDPCTVGESCENKSCGGATPLSCDDGNPCTTDVCTPGVGCVHIPAMGPCDDGDPCTDDDACQGGACLGVALVDCDDGDPCTDDLCTENLGCEHPLNTAPCEDGDLCSIGDTCAGGLCVPGGLPDCDDGNPCTDDLCLSDEGCSSANNSGPCDDGNICTLGDACSAGACVGAGALSCDDQNPCTDDLCDSIDGCLHVISEGGCDDGDPCTEGDACIGVQCIGQEKECADINPCTNDVCEQGVCLHPSNTADCNDGNPCTTIDYCLNGSCIGTDPLDCGDDNPCTNDSCDHTSGCKNSPNFDLCDDDDPCTAQSQCQSKVCVGVAFMECEDGNACTDDECVPDVGCVTTNNTNLCDDQKACSTNDQCEDGVCTGDQGGNPCSDSNPCTTDTCTDVGGCVYELNTQACDDGDPCTENDACSVGQCEGSQKICEADEPCVDSYCGEGGVCVEEIAGSCCGNGELDPGETCDDGNQSEGDGCPANCLQGSCPAGSASLHGFCWVIATSLAGVDQGHPEACASIGKAQTDTKVNIPWDSQTLNDVASQLGYSSAGTYACCAHAMWCNAGNGTCGTHNMGSPFHNYGPYADSSWWPVYTCYP